MHTLKSLGGFIVPLPLPGCTAWPGAGAGLALVGERHLIKWEDATWECAGWYKVYRTLMHVLNGIHQGKARRKVMNEWTALQHSTYAEVRFARGGSKRERTKINVKHK